MTTTVVSKRDVRVAVVGNVDAGKSTLIGVLVAGELDDGRGRGRAKVFRHRHEHDNGRTSSVSHHLMGFDADGKPVRQVVPASASSAVKSRGWRDVYERSESLLTLIDLAGHERYLKTTVGGLTGGRPDFCMVVVGANMGVTKMTKEHLSVVLALGVPLILVVTKIDMAPGHVTERTKQKLHRILKSPAARKKPFNVRDATDVDFCVDKVDDNKVVPVFFVSTVAGDSMDLLESFLSRLRRPSTSSSVSVTNTMLGGATAEKENTDGEDKTVDVENENENENDDADATSEAVDSKSEADDLEFVIDENFVVPGVGLVLSGVVVSGTMRSGSTALLGPFSDNKFHPVVLRSLQFRRVPVDECEAGNSCAVAIRPVSRKLNLRRRDIRSGMVIVADNSRVTGEPPRGCWAFTAKVLVLHHPTTIKRSYQTVVHCGAVRQTVSLTHMSAECLRTGDKAEVRFQFLRFPEWIRPGSAVVFREGTTKGIGRVTEVHYDATAPVRSTRQVPKNRPAGTGKRAVARQ